VVDPSLTMEVSACHARTRAITRDTLCPANRPVTSSKDASRDDARVVSDVSVCVRGVLLKLTTNAVHVTVERFTEIDVVASLRSSTTAALRRGCLLLAGGFAPPYL
jgi:hypothetical protein